MSQPLSLSETQSPSEQVFSPQNIVSNSAAVLDKRAQQNKKPVITQPVTTLPLKVQTVPTKPLTVSTESLNTVFRKIQEFFVRHQKLVDVIQANSANEIAKLES